MTEPIFVGGTGRSGTTVLARTLGLNRSVYAFPFETRFLIDPDGLLDLAVAMSSGWSPYKGSVAAERFCSLMNALKKDYRQLPLELADKFGRHVLRLAPIMRYRGVDFSRLLPVAEFESVLDEFLGEIVQSRSPGTWFGTRAMRWRPTITLLGRRSTESAMRACEGFARDLVGRCSGVAGARYWLDHCPYNVVHARSLAQMFPSSKFMHIVRDPRDVVSSLKRVRWGGGSTQHIVAWIKDVYAAWADQRRELDPRNFMDLRMEDFVEAHDASMSRICEFLGIDPDDAEASPDLSKHNTGRWRKDLADADRQIVERELESVFQEYGYDL